MLQNTHQCSRSLSLRFRNHSKKCSLRWTWNILMKICRITSVWDTNYWKPFESDFRMAKRFFNKLSKRERKQFIKKAQKDADVFPAEMVQIMFLVYDYLRTKRESWNEKILLLKPIVKELKKRGFEPAKEAKSWMNEASEFRATNLCRNLCESNLRKNVMLTMRRDLLSIAREYGINL